MEEVKIPDLGVLWGSKMRLTELMTYHNHFDRGWVRSDPWLTGGTGSVPAG